MWGLLLTHVTVTESDSSCCQGKRGWREWRWHLRLNSKEEKGKKALCGSNNRISVNYPSSALYLHLHFNLWRARDAKKIIHHYFIKHPDRIWLTKISVQFSHFHIPNSTDINNTTPPTVPVPATGLRNHIKLNLVITDLKIETTFISLLHCGLHALWTINKHQQIAREYRRQPFREEGVLYGKEEQEYMNSYVITIWSSGNVTKAKLCFQVHSNVCLCVPLSKQTGQQFPVQLFPLTQTQNHRDSQSWFHKKPTAEHSDKLDPLSSNQQLCASHESVGQVALGTDPDSIMGWINTIKEFILLL